MIQYYIEAINRALYGTLQVLTMWWAPLTCVVGLIVIVGGSIMKVAGERIAEHIAKQNINWGRIVRYAFGYSAISLLLIVGWAMLRMSKTIVQQDMKWRASVETTRNPVPDAKPVAQSGPIVAALVQRTYKRTLTLPPSFVNRLGAEGAGALAPYLTNTDPSSPNMAKLRDTFRRSGRKVVFTRESIIKEEEPLPITDTRVKVSFRRLPERAYDATFEAQYAFGNNGLKPRPIHFLFTLPDASTVRNLNISVGNEAVTQRNDSNTYEWKAVMAPGETRTATVSYRVIGERVWSYDIGSARRRVQQFQLDANPAGEVRFLRGGLQPNAQTGQSLSWQLSDVVTAQKASLVFPPDNMDNQLYVQALSALPASFVLFFAGILACGLWWSQLPEPARVGGALLGFCFGLGTSTVAAIYLGPAIGLIVGPLCGAFLVSWALGRRYLLPAIPVALLPATFLSAQNTGLMIIGLCALTLLIVALMGKHDRKMAQGLLA